jgi:hypothetical protein
MAFRISNSYSREVRDVLRVASVRIGLATDSSVLGNKRV